MQQPRIEILGEHKLIGNRISTSIADNQTFKLWSSFMPRRKEIKNILSNNLFSVQVYPSLFDFTFANLSEPFEKWATVEVSNFDSIPEGMESFNLQEGLYAVWDYKGLNTDTRIFEYIFGDWIINSKEYCLDNRPHFEILGEKYKNNHPDSEEEIWIPIKARIY